VALQTAPEIIRRNHLLPAGFIGLVWLAAARLAVLTVWSIYPGLASLQMSGAVRIFFSQTYAVVIMMLLGLMIYYNV